MRTSAFVPLSVAAALAAALLARPAAPAAKSPPLAPPKHLGLTGGASSIDELVARFLAALAAKDRSALERLRVSEREYLDVILPGNVNPGDPLQRMPAETAKYFWDVLNTKSLYSEQYLLATHGGRTYRVKNIAFAKGQKQFAWFEAYQQLRLSVEDESGGEQEIRTGSIAKVRGRFKFVSYLRD